MKTAEVGTMAGGDVWDGGNTVGGVGIGIDVGCTALGIGGIGAGMEGGTWAGFDLGGVGALKGCENSGSGMGLGGGAWAGRGGAAGARAWTSGACASDEKGESDVGPNGVLEGGPNASAATTKGDFDLLLAIAKGDFDVDVDVRGSVAVEANGHMDGPESWVKGHSLFESEANGDTLFESEANGDSLFESNSNSLFESEANGDSLLES